MQLYVKKQLIYSTISINNFRSVIYKSSQMRYYSLSTWTGCQTGMKTCDANVVYSAAWDSLFSEHVIQSFRDVYRCLNGFTSKFSHHTLSSLCFQHNIYIYVMARQHFVLWYHFIIENLLGKQGSVEALN